MTLLSTINGAQYQSFQYPGGSVDGRNKCIRDAGLILEGVMADLLTGGNNSSLRAVETYLNSRQRFYTSKIN